MYKKFFCIALFLLMLVGMTCVVASEDINTDNDAIANVEDFEVQSAPIDDIDDDLSTDNDIDTISADSNNKKKDPNLDCELETTDAYVTITANVTKNATGNVAIKIKEVNDKNYKVNTTAKIKNGTAVWSEYMAFEKISKYNNVRAEAFVMGKIVCSIEDSGFSNVDQIIDKLIAMLPKNIRNIRVQFKITNIDKNLVQMYQRLVH